MSEGFWPTRFTADPGVIGSEIRLDGSTTFVCVTLVIGIIAALSILGPAWRAAHIDPAVALRNT